MEYGGQEGVVYLLRSHCVTTRKQESKPGGCSAFARIKLCRDAEAGE